MSRFACDDSPQCPPKGGLTPVKINNVDLLETPVRHGIPAVTGNLLLVRAIRQHGPDLF
jgi:hypothetical protein